MYEITALLEKSAVLIQNVDTSLYATFYLYFDDDLHLEPPSTDFLNEHNLIFTVRAQHVKKGLTSLEWHKVQTRIMKLLNERK